MCYAAQMARYFIGTGSLLLTFASDYKITWGPTNALVFANKRQALATLKMIQQFGRNRDAEVFRLAKGRQPRGIDRWWLE